MTVESLITILLIGAIAGWLAGTFMKGRGFGIIGNIAVGILGAFVGGFLFDLLGLIASGFIGTVIMATLGAVVLLYVVALLKRT